MAIAQRTKFIPGKSFYIGGIGFMLVALAVMYETSRMGSSPEAVTPNSAVAAMEARKGKHWVRLSGLEVRCESPLQEKDDGKITRTVYVGMDESGSHAFVVQQEAACDGNANHVYEGTLEMAPKAVLDLARKYEVALPPDEQIYFVWVGEGPASNKKFATGFGLTGVFVLIVTYFSRKKVLG